MTKPQEYQAESGTSIFTKKKNALHQVCIPAQTARKKVNPNDKNQ